VSLPVAASVSSPLPSLAWSCAPVPARPASTARGGWDAGSESTIAQIVVASPRPARSAAGLLSVAVHLSFLATPKHIAGRGSAVGDACSWTCWLPIGLDGCGIGSGRDAAPFPSSVGGNSWRAASRSYRNARGGGVFPAVGRVAARFAGACTRGAACSARVVPGEAPRAPTHQGEDIRKAGADF
jgi:hypothetical protein